MLRLALMLLAWLAADERAGRETIAAKVRALAVPDLRPAEQGELSLLLLELPEPDLPLSVRIDVGALSLSENRLGWSAVVDPQALQPRVRARFGAPAQPGEYRVRAQVDYSVCAGDWCRRKQGEVEWLVRVVAPPGG